MVRVILASAVAFLGIGLVCATNAPGVPEFAFMTDPVYVRAEAEFLVTTTVPGDRDVQYVLDWGDGTVDTTLGKKSGDTVSLRHTWETAGSYPVRALAFVQEEPDLASEWTEPLQLVVRANGAPQPDAPQGPEYVAVNVWATFQASASEPDGDSVQLQFDWGDGAMGDWSMMAASNQAVEDSHRFEEEGTYAVRCRARDAKGTVSDWSDSALIQVDTAGRLLWYWMGENNEKPVSQLLTVLDGIDEVTCFLDEEGNVRTLNLGSGQEKEVLPSPSPNDRFAGLPAYCAAAGHIIVGSELGRLYALTPSLRVAWCWSDSLAEVEWGAPAIRGDTLYLTRDNDTLYCFKDLGDTVELVATKHVPILATYGGPLVQSNGNVYCSDQGGRLYCWFPGLDSLFWMDTIVPGGNEVWCIAAGDDGMVYCGGYNARVYAVTAAGEVAWSTDVESEVEALVAGEEMVYAVTDDEGGLHALDAATGLVQWTSSHPFYGSETSPILTANGLIYCQDRDDVLYCIDRLDGSLVWSCDCPGYLDGFQRSGFDSGIPASPTITSNGDVILVGEDALYCVKGYTAGTLSDDPWPKWQRDVHNSGSMPGQ